MWVAICIHEYLVKNKQSNFIKIIIIHYFSSAFTKIQRNSVHQNFFDFFSSKFQQIFNNNIIIFH